MHAHVLVYYCTLIEAYVHLLAFIMYKNLSIFKNSVQSRRSAQVDKGTSAGDDVSEDELRKRFALAS